MRQNTQPTRNSALHAGDAAQLEGSAVLMDAQLEQIIVRRAESETHWREAEGRWRTQSEMLLSLAKTSLSDEFDLKSNLERIPEAGVRILEVQRASLWLVDSNGTLLQCVAAAEADAIRPSPMLDFPLRNFPFDLSVLDRERVMAIHDVLRDEGMWGTAPADLASPKASSVLYAPIRVGGKLAGLLCHEHTGPPRRWSPEEQAFAASLADMATLALQADQRRQTEIELRFRTGILGQVTDAVVCWDRNERITYWSPGAEKMYRLPAAQAKGRRVREIWQLGDAEVTPQNESEWRGQQIHRLPDGSPLPVELKVSPLTPDDGQSAGWVAVVRDLTDRRIIEEALRESEARFRAVVESDMMGIGFCDPSGVISDVNPALANLLGYDRGDFESTAITWMSLSLPQFQKRNRTALNEIARSGTCTPFETEFQRHDGSHFPALVGAGVIAGQKEQAAFFVVDLTEKKRTERQLSVHSTLTQILSTSRNLEEGAPRILELICQTFEAAVATIWMVDKDREVMRCVDIWHQPLPELMDFKLETYSRRVSIGEGIPGRVWFTGRPVWIDELGMELEHRFARNAQNCGLRSGACFPIQIRQRTIGVIEFFSQTPSKAEDNLLKMVTAFGNQIGLFVDQRAQEAALQEGAERLRLAVNSTGLGTWDFDPQSGELRWSDFCKAAFGFPPEAEITFAKFLAAIHPDDRESTRQRVEKALDPKGDGSFDSEYRSCWPDGSEHWIIARGQALFEGQGEHRHATRFIGTVLDITERKRNEEELRQAQEQLLQYTSDLENRVAERTVKLNTTIKSLESFCYSIAHDLRAPLRAMQGLTTALREDYGDRLDDVGRNYAERIAASAARMDNLVQDLLTYGRLAHSDLNMQEVDVCGALQSVLVQLSEEIRNRGARIELQRPFPKVLGHPVVLEQVFGNLLTNALKFARKDVQPEIRVFAEEDRKTVRLRFQDNGIGIAPEHHERIFRIFERLHVNKEFSGTGIGLAIVQKGVERLGGRVGVESQVGKGSVFWLDLHKPPDSVMTPIIPQLDPAP